MMVLGGTGRSPRRSRAWSGLVVALALQAGPARSQAPPPNIVLLQSDDHGWPYYGFMQRYLRAKVGVGELIAHPAGSTGYDDPAIVLPEDHMSSTPSSDCGVIDPECQTCTGANCTAPLHTFLTPALDSLAEGGMYFPVAHTPASVCRPSFASTLTGLYMGDYVLTGGRTTSPIVPELLPGFDDRGVALASSTYLTMVAGKWWGETFVQDDDLHRAKAPFDRDMPRGPTSASGARAILKPYQSGGPALEPVKDFIACARCTDPTKCRSPAFGADPDSTRLLPRATNCAPQPFFIMLSPSLPHQNPLTGEFCPLFPRDEGQCSQEPYRTHSQYCQYDPAFDLNGDGDHVDDADEFRTCDFVVNTMIRVSSNLHAEGRERESNALSASRDYYRWINVWDRVVDELLVYLKANDLLSTTVVLMVTDNSAGIPGSKRRFLENGYRSPIILYNPFAPAPASCGPGLPGCRGDFADSVDILATIRDFAGTASESCPPRGVTCSTGCCPAPRPDGQSRYGEGRSLRNPSSRACLYPPGFDEAKKPFYRQCLLDRSNTGSQSVKPDTSLALLAEVAEPSGAVHLCKLYTNNCATRGLFDLISDPYEQADLHGSLPSPAFCATEQANLELMLRYVVQQDGWLSCDGSQ